MNKRLRAFTLFLFVINTLLALLCLASCIILIIVSNFILPDIVLWVTAIVFVLLSIHYFKCFVYTKQSEIPSNIIESARTVNNVIIAVAMTISIAFTLILLYTLVIMRIIFEFQIFFLAVDIISTLYLIGSAAINKKLSD